MRCQIAYADAAPFRLNPNHMKKITQYPLKTKLKLSAALGLIIIVLIVIFQNTEPVETQVLFFTITMPRATLLAVTMLVGVAEGIIIALGMTKWKEKKD